jgi:hypothetical protein
VSKHRRARPRRRLAGNIARAGLLLLLVVVLGIVLSAGRLQREPTAPLLRLGVAGAAPSPSPTTSAAEAAPRWPAFARAAGITLYLPVRHPVAVLYHEASFHDALRLRPLGHLARNANHWGFSRLPATPGPGYIVMSSRGRGTPATSAADVVIPARTPVRSPVTGTVIAVRPYRLYCTYPDVQVRIRTRGGGGRDIVLIHLDHVEVQPGERVFATLSVIGTPRVFPFRSQVDDYVRGGNPHVHIEITKPHPPRHPTCQAGRRQGSR